MRFYVALATGVSLLTAQTRVPTQLTIPAGTQRDILLQIPAPRKGDMIDILAGDAKVTIVLPDGREATKSSAIQAGVTWAEVSAAEARAGDSSMRGFLLEG